MENVRFISYDGAEPSLCFGTLVLEIEGKEVSFGRDGEHRRFWESGGFCGFTNNYENSYINKDEWVIDPDYLPDEYRQYSEEILEVINENIPYGCCGGCL